MSVWQPSVTREKYVCRLLTVCLVCGGLTRTVVVKHEPETVCLQGKSWAFLKCAGHSSKAQFFTLKESSLLFQFASYFSQFHCCSASFLPLSDLGISQRLCLYTQTESHPVAPAVTPARGYKHGAVHDQLKWQLCQGESGGYNRLITWISISKISIYSFQCANVQKRRRKNEDFF